MSAVQPIPGINDTATVRSRNWARIRHLFLPPDIDAPRRTRGGQAPSRPERTLPVELWAEIWCLLHITDRVTVLHVCTAWRDMAMSSPIVWAHLDYYHAAPKNRQWGGECSLWSHAWRTHFTLEQLEGLDKVSGFNTKLIEHVLPFTGQGPLFLSLQVIVRHADTEQIAELARILRPHSARIVSIDISAWSATFPIQLLDQLDALPKLRALRVSHVSREPVEGSYFPITSKPESLPALEELFLGPPENGLPLGDSFLAPNLHTLTFPVSDAHQIPRALQTCPGLHTLTAELRLGDDVPDDDMVREIAASSAQLKKLCFKNVFAGDEEWIESSFKLDGLTTLELQYSQNSDPPDSSAWQMFRSLSSEVTLEVTREVDDITICGTDVRGVSRAITLDAHCYTSEESEQIREIFRQLWMPDAISARKVTRLELDQTDLFDFMDEFPEDNSVEEIVLFAFNMPRRRSSRRGSTTFFPVIEKLTLVRSYDFLPAFTKKAIRFLEWYLGLDVNWDELHFDENPPQRMDVTVWPCS